MKKKVLFLVNHDIVIYNFRLELVEQLIAEGFDISVSCPYGERIDKLKALGCHCYDIKIERHGTNPIHELTLLCEYRKLYAQVKPDIILGYTIKPNIYGTVSKINVGDFAYGKLDSVISGVKYENEIKIFNVLPSYTLIGTNTSSFKFEDDSYFIPLVYTKKVILNKSYVEIIMNEKKYYIDQFPFMITDTPYQDFKERGVKGAINYA